MGTVKTITFSTTCGTVMPESFDLVTTAGVSGDLTSATAKVRASSESTEDKDYTLLGYCTNLTDIDFYGEIMHSLRFKYNPLLNSNSINNIIRALHDYSSGGGPNDTTVSFPIGFNITDQQKSAITAKGWTIVWA